MDSLEHIAVETPVGDLRRASATAMAAMMEEYESLLPYLTHGERSELDGLLGGVHVPLWEPFPGPQTLALECGADELFYGGAAGGGKTDLLLGVAITKHMSSVIFRREYAELKGIHERAWELFDDVGKYNAQQGIWRFRDSPFRGKRIEFGACQFEGDERKFQGRPHDLKSFDEVTQFTEAQFRFLIVWNRTTSRNQRCRVIATGNPPVNTAGQWVIKYWGPWLDPAHPNPAKQGELRWFVTGPDGKDLEVDGPEAVEVEMLDGSKELITPKSRSFIRARVEDNPRLMETGYRTILQNLPEPLRSRMLRGDFGVGHEDEEWQVIPTDWILKAQARWLHTYERFLQKQFWINQEKSPASKTEESIKNRADKVNGNLNDQSQKGAEAWKALQDTVGGRSGVDLSLLTSKPNSNGNLARGKDTSSSDDYVLLPEKRELTEEELAKAKLYAQQNGAIGVDVSRGGKDATTFSERLGNWFAQLVVIPGKQTKDGNDVINTLIRLGFIDRRIQIDVAGVGTSPVDIGKMYGMNIIPMVMAGKSRAKDRSGKLGFSNLRAEWWWKFREALDPVLGDDLALPPDSDLAADLTSVKWSVTARGILVESKEHVKSRLGRSPDKGDAVVMAHATPHIVAEAYLHYMKDLSDEAKSLRADLADTDAEAEAADAASVE